MSKTNETKKNTITELIINLKVGETLTRPINLIDSTRGLIDIIRRKQEHRNKVFSCFQSSDKTVCIVTREPEFNIPNELKEFIGDVFAGKDDALALKAGEMFQKYCM